ncbi:hypothetical protein [Acinetobacter bohemicus]|uniref:hypothetical protein n=1 Tax=Acinetobacter bohemicus TaxID=1435036 RepID=UPI004042AC5E
MNTKLLNKVIMACLFVSPITHIYADTYRLHEERQRYLEQQRQSDEKIRAYQADRDAKWEYERRKREYQQRLDTARKPELPTQQQINKLADLMNSDDAKNAVSYMENLQPDPYQPQQVERAEMDGFYMSK